MLCVKCNKFPAEVYISGKYLCKACARDEIIRRIRRELSLTKFLDRNDNALIIFPEFYKDVAQLISNTLRRICKECNFNFSYLEVADDEDLNKVLWNVVITIKSIKEANKIILPFTADFYLAYLVYSSTLGNYYYLYLYNLTLKIFDKNIFVPFYETPRAELKGFSEITGELNVKDPLFNEILKWSRNSFIDNEIFHSFGNSIDVIINNSKGKCVMCNAILMSSESSCCKYCSESFSHLCLEQPQNKVVETRS